MLIVLRHCTRPSTDGRSATAADDARPPSDRLADGRRARKAAGGLRMIPIVETRQGKVRGSVSDGVNTFNRIPYAAPPFGANRFRRPQPVVPWSGVRDALTFGANAP